MLCSARGGLLSVHAMLCFGESQEDSTNHFGQPDQQLVHPIHTNFHALEAVLWVSSLPSLQAQFDPFVKSLALQEVCIGTCSAAPYPSTICLHSICMFCMLCWRSTHAFFHPFSLGCVARSTSVQAP